MTFWIECLAGSASESDGWSGAYDGMRRSRSGSTGLTATVGPVPPDTLAVVRQISFDFGTEK